MLWFLMGVFASQAGEVSSAEVKKANLLHCGNLIYAKTQSSVCFADRFLTRVSTDTHLQAAKKFTPVKLGSADVFKMPISVFSGEGKFQLTSEERENLHRYLSRGGFVLASPGCSDKEWDASFRQEIGLAFPDHKLKKISMDHEIFSTVYKIDKLTLAHGGTTLLEGLEIDGRIVMIYSAEGLNDVKHAKGCCCCGGDQINECERVNVNIFTYALLY